jgi:hypothetical protein
VQSDFAVELGPGDDALEFPWSAEESGVRYFDLKRHPELVAHLEEARRVPEIGSFLSAVNAPACILETAKCDAWSSTEINPEEEIFGAAYKFGSYFDFLFSDLQSRFLFAEHERLAMRLVDLLQRIPEIPVSAEFIIRRCYYREKEEESRDGFYITFYLFGYGDDESGSRERWTIGLNLVQNAISQLSAGWR